MSTRKFYEAFKFLWDERFWAYLFLFSIPVSVPLARTSLKVFLLVFFLNVLFRLRKLKLEKVDFIVLSFPAYQFITLLFKGELINFLRVPNGILPSLSYLLRFSAVDVVRALKIFLIGSSVLSFAVILQSLLPIPDYIILLRGDFQLHFHFSVVRPLHTFVGHPLTAGALSSTGFILSVILYLKFKRFFYLFSAFLNLLAVILLFDRTYWLAVSLVCFVIFFLVLRNFRLFIPFALIFILPVLTVPQIKERFTSIFDVKHNVSNRYRLAMWVGALEFYSQAPIEEKLFGVGREGYKSEVRPFVEGAEKEFKLSPHLFSHLHNDFITVLVWYGLLGLVIFLFVFFYLLFLNLRAFRETSDYLYLFFFSFYLLILIGGIFEYNFEDGVVKCTIYSLMGLNVKLLKGGRVL